MKKFFIKLLRKNFYPKPSEYEIQFAFTSGGVDYYQFTDIANMPALRGIRVMVFYEEMRMKCSFEYLQAHCEAVDKTLMKKEINIFRIKQLNDQMKQRLDIAIETELVYKLASVVFFDKDENLQDYDFDYNAKKISRFKRHEEDGFFLLKPIQDFLPFLKDVKANLVSYSNVVEQINKLHWANLSLSKQTKKM